MILDTKQLSDLVIKILKFRQNNLGIFDIEKDQLDNSFHIEHELIRVVNISIDHLNQLIKNKNNDWVEWIKTGLSYNNEITFQLKYDDYQTLPIDFLNTYSIKILNTKENQIYLFNEKAITFQQVHWCKPDNIIVIQKNQLITDYAKEYCHINDINLIERF